MRITKNQLRRIIKEESAKLITEQAVRNLVRRRLLEQAANNQNGGSIVDTRSFYDNVSAKLGAAAQPPLEAESSEFDVNFGNGLIVSQQGTGKGVRRFRIFLDGADSQGLAPADHLTPEQIKEVGLTKFGTARKWSLVPQALSPLEPMFAYTDFQRTNGEVLPRRLQKAWQLVVGKQRRQFERMLKMVQAREQKFAGTASPEALEGLARYGQALEAFLMDTTLGLPAMWTPIESI